MRKVSKSKCGPAETAAMWYLHEVCHCDPAQIRKAIRAKFQSVDFWACDVMGRTKRGEVFFAQVTTGGNEAVRVRRRKLEKISWNDTETVMVLQLVESQNPTDARKKVFHFRVHNLEDKDQWYVEPESVLVPRKWFKRFQVEERR